jgi:hypothetical protein
MTPEMAARQDGQDAATRPLAKLYARLCAPMPTHQKQGLDYISGEQAIRRANETLGVNAWDFEVRRTWYDREADCVLCLGRLTIRWPDGTSSVHEDIGSQIPNRKRDGGAIIELGSDFKGARTDCLKRCLADVGIALWLYHKAEPGEARTAHPAAPVGARTPVARPPAITNLPDAKGEGGWTVETDPAATAQLPAKVQAAWREWNALAAELDSVGMRHKTPPPDASLEQLQGGIAAYRKRLDGTRVGGDRPYAGAGVTS